MSYTHSTAVRNAIATSVGAEIDAGAAAGELRFKDAADQVLVSIPMGTPMPAPSNGQLDLLAGASKQGTVALAGTADRFDMRDSNGVVTQTGAAGSVTGPGGGGNYELTNVNLQVSDTVTVTSNTYTAPTGGA